MIDYSRLEAIVREAGRIAMDCWPGAGHSVRSWDKGKGDPVCEADLAVDAFLRRELGALLPSAGWLSEESADDIDRLADRLVWVVDPVDGTRDFIRGRSGWAVSAARLLTSHACPVRHLCGPFLCIVRSCAGLPGYNRRAHTTRDSLDTDRREFDSKMCDSGFR